MDREAWLLKCCTQDAHKFGKLSSGHRTGKGVFIPVPKKGSGKDCSNYCTVALISHVTKVMVNILTVRLKQYVKWEHPLCACWIQKRQRSQRSNCQHPLVHSKSKSVPEKHLLLLYWLCQRLWLCGSQQIVENSSRDGNTRPPYLPPEKAVCRWRNTS